MDEFVRNEINENPSEEENESPKAEEFQERNTNAPSGWTYSANTNQYVSWDGSSDDNNTQWNPGNSEPEQQQPPRMEYGTRYGYYGGPQQTNYYSANGNYQWDFNKYESADTSFRPKEKKSSKKGLRVFLGIIGALVAVCLISFSSIGIYRMLTGENRVNPSEFFEPSPAPSDGENFAPGISPDEIPEIILQDIPKENTVSTDGKLSATEVYKIASPSVVGIVQYQNGSSSAEGSGSGIILSSDGYVVTNAHVIDGADTIKVVLYNEEEYNAFLVGSDPQTDIAVLKIGAKNLVAAEFGDSSQVEIGETVYALGNPGGLALQSSFTDGMISGLNRLITTNGIYTRTVIQTSAAINPGNSGGALLNEYGQVIGITNSKIVTASYEGIGFAIPTEIAIPIIEEIIQNGYVSGRAKLGITGLTVDLLTSVYDNVPQGVRIATIDDYSCFTGTDVKPGDIIISFDGKEIIEMTDLQSLLPNYSPGDEVEITLYRSFESKGEGQTFTVTVKLIENKG